MYRLVERYYDEVKGLWEDCFESRFGRWRGFLDSQVLRYLDCGVHECGFARLRCPECRAEVLVAFSCQTRTFCPSCAAKRSAVFATFLSEEVLAEVGHWMVTFTVPRMLRPLFLHDRRLLGGLARAAWQTVRALMAEAAAVDEVRPAMVASLHTAGDDLRWHPHIHAIVPRGVWRPDGTWVPVPYLDAAAAEKVFRHEVLSFLKAEGAIGEERIELLLSWRHSGFSVDLSVRVEPEDEKAVERVSRYILRSPLSLERLELDGGVARYRSKNGRTEHRLDPRELLARVLMQAPEPRLHLVRYYGAYSSVARARSPTDGAESAAAGGVEGTTAAERRRLRRSWARMIRKIYEVDPLLCECGTEMRVISFITEHAVVRRILGHIRASDHGRGRGPPGFAA